MHRIRCRIFHFPSFPFGRADTSCHIVTTRLLIYSDFRTFERSSIHQLFRVMLTANEKLRDHELRMHYFIGARNNIFYLLKTNLQPP